MFDLGRVFDESAEGEFDPEGVVPGLDRGDLSLPVDDDDVVGQAAVKLVAGEHAHAQLHATHGHVGHTGTDVVAVVQQEVVDDVHVLDPQAALADPELGFGREGEAAHFHKRLCGADVATAPLGGHVVHLPVDATGLEALGKVDFDAVVTFVTQAVLLQLAAQRQVADADDGADFSSDQAPGKPAFLRPLRTSSAASSSRA